MSEPNEAQAQLLTAGMETLVGACWETFVAGWARRSIKWARICMLSNLLATVKPVLDEKRHSIRSTGA
jgi:hypothetical protein